MIRRRVAAIWGVGAAPLLLGVWLAASAHSSAPPPYRPASGLPQASSPGGARQEATTRTPATSCIGCHGDADLFEPEWLAIVEGFQEGVHAEVGLSCHDCHGGNPDAALADDYVAAKDEEFEPNPYRGVPEKARIPEFCGSCHSDPTYMRRFNPDARVDQVREYWTSQHGHSLRQGITRVAACTDCHGVHGILRPDNPGSRVYPTQVAETCAGCHADQGRMAGSTLPDGRPLPVDQYARWRRSVHARALLETGDLSAPTCNDCHGNHGAVPPGLESITFVCGQCHGREAEIFRVSPKHQGFQEHNEFLAEAGVDGCAACHDLPEPQADITDVRTLSECAACHGNHDIVRPTLAMLSPLPEVPCAFCHEAPGSVLGPLQEREEVVRNYERTRDGLLQVAAEQGLQGVERFNWLVGQALRLPTHTVAGVAGDGGAPGLRPEFRRLFEKFRIGKTTYTYDDPVTGEATRASIRRCEDCHAGAEVLGDDAAGLRVAEGLLERMWEVTIRTAQAERTLLAARRGGVETRRAAALVEQAVNAQIELEVLLHTFSTVEEGPFMSRYREGVRQADAALSAGRAALRELTTRRRGLAVFLAIVVVVLVALALKIREVSGRAGPPGGGGRSVG